MTDLISDDYRVLNQQLHETNTDYGNSGELQAGIVSQLVVDKGYSSVLDYGCGKGRLKAALGNNLVREYDPAVPGKDSEPERADLVVCCDVLEHVEPDRLDAVLKHIKGRMVRDGLFVIATRPAKKTLADGRNAHLIVENADWWRDRLSRFFMVEMKDKSKKQVAFMVQPLVEIGTIQSKSAVSDDLRYEQAKINIAKVGSRVAEHPRREFGHAILCAYGPSLNETWNSIEAERSVFPGSVVVTVSGAHDFLIERGIVPDYHIEVDPRAHKAVFTEKSHPDVHYLIASCCHPKTVDQLINRHISLFHVYNGERDLDIINEIEPDQFLLSGGGSVGLRAFNLLYGLGYRSFSTRGLDSSFSTEHGQHAAAHSGKVQSECRVRCGDQMFLSSYIQVAYARFFFENFQQLCRISVRNGEPPINEHGDQVHLVIHGESLLAAMAQQIMKQDQ